MAKKFSAKNYDNLTEQEKQEYKEQIVAKAKQRVIRNRIVTISIAVMTVFALFIAARVAWVRYVCIEIENNEVTIVRNYTLLGGNLNIPDKMFGYPVTAIGERVFEDRNDIISVKIPDSVTNIGDLAFSNCGKLKSVVIPDSVKDMGGGVFFGCDSLKSVVLSNSLTTIPQSTFCSCPMLKDVINSENITFIGSYAFMNCVSLESFVIPDSVTVIEVHLFTGCESLKEVKIGSGLTDIPHGTFMSCGLTEVVIPENIRTINENAFNGTTITVTASHDVEYYGFPEVPENVTWVIDE